MRTMEREEMYEVVEFRWLCVFAAAVVTGFWNVPASVVGTDWIWLAHWGVQTIIAPFTILHLTLIALCDLSCAYPWVMIRVGSALIACGMLYVFVTSWIREHSRVYDERATLVLALGLAAMLWGVTGLSYQG